MKAHREYLGERKRQEASMEKEVDRLIQIELDKANRRQDEIHEKESMARARLMKEVEESRIKQLQELGKKM